MSIYAEARTRQLLVSREGLCAQCDGMMQVVEVDPPAGHLVARGTRLQANLTLRNTGDTRWEGRELRRMGAYAGLRLIGSAPATTVPDTDPGELAGVRIDLEAPGIAGSVIAYWSMRHSGRGNGAGDSLGDAEGDTLDECPQTSAPVAVLLVVD